MSESIVRKVQPFTIGTRLSVPTVPKCQEFTQSYLQSQSLDNCTLQHNLNSLYLSQSQVCVHGPCLVSPIVKQVAPIECDQEHMAAEDHLNQNVSSPSAVSRSIKKITISGSKERSENKGAIGPAQLSIAGSTSENNNNNNNVTRDPHLPRIVGVSCENKPNSQFKVLLRKDRGDEVHSTKGLTTVKVNVDKSVQQISLPETQKHELPRKDSHLPTQKEASAAVSSQTECFTHRNSLFNKEVLQAEAWIKAKLQDLKDGCNIQRCPLQDWEEASQTLQRDLKDFENTLIQLNQMGEQLICKLNPTSDLVKKQLSQLRDQWQTLKQTAANQTRALGGAKNLQDFNKKVDKLEAWIKEKEEEQSLGNVLGENVDKMQLTRRILDLKQDEQLYRNLHEEINQLALKLEKQGKTDGKNISSRRKHINKMWLKVQSHLKNCHENLQLALEVSSFYQQADNTLFGINNMRESISATKELDNFGDREIRDIASQIMMLDVSVSQLSNVHPALAASITQKQSEVKECWALLQKVFRNDRTTLSPTGSTFTREDTDPLTPAREPQCNVGTETQRIMGKEVKEEQNRMKGCVSTVKCRSTLSSQSQEQQSGNHTFSPMGDSSACSDDVIVRHQLRGESKKPRAELKLATTPQGHPQLQRFTVSADKTLSWLKDNVSMATQVCSVASFDGLDAARRCQHALEQEILTNRARIEVVKREGRGLVRAQHPGSAKIEEFLGQLEVLWEELRRRHQRNAVFLQASEELGFRVVKVLQALGSLEAWLESVELSMKESALAGDPETMSMAERESCLLEKEVAARSLELSALRQEVDHLHYHSHPHTRGLAARMEEVERKYHRVQCALNQQSSELQDTRMLTEFLERVELEESQELSSSQYSLGQPLHTEISSAPTLLELQSSSSGEPLIEVMVDPVEELREAVEMLNDTVRERGRSQSHDQAIQELLRDHASLVVRMEECLCHSKELNLDILEKETDMAVQCEPDRCGLEALQEKQDHLEIDYEVIREELKEMEKQASRLEELCPERVHVLGEKIQATLQAWTELGKSVTENNLCLQEFVQLQDFFRSYLAMISWTEDTRSCIFSDTALYLGKDGQKPLAAELDMQIEQKFEEFDELAAKGKNLLDKEHHLAQMVRERMEELRSMLGWILVHWRAQKQQWLHKKSRQEASQDDIYSEATMCFPSIESPAPEQDAYVSHQSSVVISNEDKLLMMGGSQLSSLPPRQAEQQEEKQLEDGYEVMNSIGPRSGKVSSSESPKSSIVVLKEHSSPALGGTVNLILSFGNKGDSQVQVVDPPARMDEVVEEISEPVHRPTVPQSSACKNFWRRCQGLLENTLGSLKRKRKIYRQSANEVSTYLHVKDNNLAVAPVYESITLPRQKSRSAALASPSFLPSSSSPSSSSTPAPQTTNVTFHPLTGSGSSSIFSSLKRMSKKRKRKRDARRHTIQKIMGVDEQTEENPHCASDTITYNTNTWPLKEGRRKKRSPKSPVSGDGAEALAYLKNPLLNDIDTECSEEYNITPYAVSKGPTTVPSTTQVRNHCRFLSLGSVLSFDLPKDMTLIPSIQDIITIAPPESKKGAGTDPDPHSQRHSALSSFKQIRPTPAVSNSSADITFAGTQTSMVEAKDLPGMDKSFQPPPPLSPEVQEDQTVPCNDLSKSQLTPHEDTEQEGDKVSSEVKTSIAEKHGTSQPPIYVNQAQTRATHKHECPSVHTLIRDLNGHQYHKCARSQCVHEESPGLQSLNQASHMVVNLKSTVNVSVRQDSVDSGISTSSNIKLCTDAPCPDVPHHKGVVGRLMSLEVGGVDCSKTRQNSVTSSGLCPESTELETDVHLNHQQFEEEEEELEDIWKQSTNYRQSICSDIMYQTNQEEPLPSEQSRESHSRSPSPKMPDVLYRNLVTASAPNLLVAEFRLPSHIQSFLGYDKEQSPKGQLPPLAVENRRSWAAFPNRDPDSKTSVTVNETASDPVKLPDVSDNQRYIYQYREDEEEEEEEAKVGKEVEEHTGCTKDQSMSLLSVHMGLDRSCQSSTEDMEKQEELMATRGRTLNLSGKPELQSMEGTLERKHKLQLGGKKASSRCWSSYYAVLHRHTLCFYQERKDTLRSSACGLPLTLIGAECSPAPEYAKKPNCFRLRLHDGSEYLLNASSRFMMKKWIMKIQANTGQSKSMCSTGVPLPDNEDLHISSNHSVLSSCHGLARCHCSSQHDVTSTFPRHKPLAAAKTKEIVVLTREFNDMPLSRLRSLDEQSAISSSHGSCCDDDEGSLKQTTHMMSGSSRDNTSYSPPSPISSSQDWLSVKRRSHSFTSATYQKIKPILENPRGLERGSNYCVTLVVGDKSSDSTSTSRSSELPLLTMARWQQDTYQDSAVRNYTSLPRPHNKSVFKKFFGKKDL